MITKRYHITTPNAEQGVIFTYEQETKTLVGIEIREVLAEDKVLGIFQKMILKEDQFLSHWKKYNGVTITEIVANITFNLFWEKYDDKTRSSKKRSDKLWSKLSEEDRMGAYFFIDTYNRNRGSAEKKYCETYLNAEQWKN